MKRRSDGPRLPLKGEKCRPNSSNPTYGEPASGNDFELKPLAVRPHSEMTSVGLAAMALRRGGVAPWSRADSRGGDGHLFHSCRPPPTVCCVVGMRWSSSARCSRAWALPPGSSLHATSLHCVRRQPSETRSWAGFGAARPSLRTRQQGCCRQKAGEDQALLAAQWQPPSAVC
jgi:hypothetical protein